MALSTVDRRPSVAGRGGVGALHGRCNAPAVPSSGRIGVQVINDYGDEILKVYEVYWPARNRWRKSAIYLLNEHMFGEYQTVKDLVDKEAEAVRVETEIAEVCGVINAATARLVRLIGQVLATESWAGWGIRSPEQWVAWKCGVGRARARSLVAMARRLPELPETRASFESGALAEDQVAVVARHASASTDVEVAELARQTTVHQLRRALGSYRFAEETQATEPDAGQAKEPTEEPRRVSFGYDDDGAWRLSAVLPADEGALWERALAEARESLFRAQAVRRARQVHQGVVGRCSRGRGRRQPGGERGPTAQP